MIETITAGPTLLMPKVWSWLPASEIEDGAMVQIRNIARFPDYYMGGAAAQVRAPESAKQEER